MHVHCPPLCVSQHCSLEGCQYNVTVRERGVKTLLVIPSIQDQFFRPRPDHNKCSGHLTTGHWIIFIRKTILRAVSMKENNCKYYFFCTKANKYL